MKVRASVRRICEGCRIILDVGGKKVVTPVDVRNAIRDAQMNGKRAVLMRLKSDEATRFVAIPIARA